MILTHHCLNLSQTDETFIKLQKKLFLRKELYLNLNQLDLFETLPYYSLWENPIQFYSHFFKKTNKEELSE